MSEWIPAEQWKTIVRNVPIVSVDLVVESPAGIVLGKRMNHPAKGEWFVPGGRVEKNERLSEAVDRVAAEELSATVELVERLGVYEHFYEHSEVGETKHYVAHGFHVRTDKTAFEPDTQHDAIRAFEQPPADLHEYVDAYLDAAAVDL
jgi:colanic acid biosynthesis protein WcaH